MNLTQTTLPQHMLRLLNSLTATQLQIWLITILIQIHQQPTLTSRTPCLILLQQLTLQSQQIMRQQSAQSRLTLREQLKQQILTAILLTRLLLRPMKTFLQTISSLISEQTLISTTAFTIRPSTPQRAAQRFMIIRFTAQPLLRTAMLTHQQ